MTKPKLLVLGSIWPEARASAASTRILALVDAFLQEGYELSFTADERENAATEALRARGVICTRLAPNDSAFDLFLKELMPDVCIFDRFTSEEKFSWRVRECCPDALRVLETIDLHFLRAARQNAFKAKHPEDLDPATILKFAGDVAQREVAAIYRSDLSLLVSDDEINLLRTTCQVPEDLLMLSRLPYPKVSSVVPFPEREHFAMIGNFRHPPNEDAVLWVRNEIWPLIRKRKSDARIDIWGAHALPKHLELTQAERGFFVRGYAEDQFDVMRRCRVNLAPLRYGAGIKGKIADAWSVGTPVVTTPVGSEGMCSGLAFGGKIASSSEEIAKAAVELHEQESEWNVASRYSLTLINHLYSYECCMQPVLDRVAYLLEHRTSHRQKNFTGQVLWQQGLRSTEYFSRWIETKRLLKDTSSHD